MFVLALLENSLRIPPELFHLDLREAVEQELNKKLANKVLICVGLCIALYDITDIGESFIKPGEGATYTKVTFRYIIFRPSMEEILVGKVKSVSREGIHVTLGFFDDIHIPPKYIPYPSRFSEDDQAWIWEYVTAEGDKHDLYIDTDDNIRFRVIEETFVDTTPTTEGTATELPKDIDNKTPYSLKGSICEQGLGVLHWWAD
ncbi:DNA-directed RNA polymerase III subunit RPC8 [Coccinella septempunctata]|uniref:DNA-directed RNA polymerase III subunit RPC8 n=1 Tax=Coccinella septempunctata TaxID=41139 RepID=UPI001D093AA2|nr:DNA-directed RNA polymerase III subunit RPC8 [Coccinella septempunctata]